MKCVVIAIIGIIGIISLIYIINPTAGFIALIPDNFPIVGNLDEAAPTVLLLSCLSYFGIDLVNNFKKDNKPINDQDEITRQ